MADQISKDKEKKKDKSKVLEESSENNRESMEVLPQSESTSFIEELKGKWNYEEENIQVRYHKKRIIIPPKKKR